MTIETPAQLRAWAKGSYPLEAAAELLIRGLNGTLLNGPWIKPTDPEGRVWFDVDGVDDAGYLSGGEYRLLLIAASFADPERTVSLNDVIPGLDRELLELVVAAVSHAGGSQEHSLPRFNPEHTSIVGFDRPGALHPWPHTPTDRA